MTNKHLPHDLAQMQSVPLGGKRRMSKERIKVWYESWKKYTIYNTKTKKTRFVTTDGEPSEQGIWEKRKKKGIEVEVLVPGTKLEHTEYIESVEDGQVYVSFSGGKDSTVLADLCAQVCQTYGWTLYLLFVNTGLEYPEIQKFVKTFAEWLRETYSIDVVLEIVRPEMRFDEVLKTYGFPVISKENSLYIRQCQNPTEKNAVTIRLREEGIKSDGTKTSVGQIPEKWMHLIDAPFPISEKCCDVMKKNPAKKYTKKTGRKPIIGTMASESRLRYRKWLQNGCNAFEKDNPSSQPLSFWNYRCFSRLNLTV